jgi:TRAP-type C4-dicarboxylate transport system permease small subunit
MGTNPLHTAAKGLMHINSLIFHIERLFVAIIMYGLVAVLFINVLFRFVLFIPSAWADELARYTFTWLVLLGSSVAMYNWEHIDINLIDTIVAKLIKDDQPRYERIMELIKKFAVICTLIFLVYLFVVYGQYLQTIRRLGTMSMFLGCSLLVPMSAIYICTGLMIFHGVCYLIIPANIRKEVAGN